MVNELSSSFIYFRNRFPYPMYQTHFCPCLILIGNCLGYLSNIPLIIDSKSYIESYFSFFCPKLSLEYITIGNDCFENVNIVMINGLSVLDRN